MKNYPQIIKNLLRHPGKRGGRKEAAGSFFSAISKRLPILYSFSALMGLLAVLIWHITLEKNILLGALAGILLFYLRYSKILSSVRIEKRRAYLILAFLSVVFIFISRKMAQFNIAPAYIPVVGFTMLIAIIFNSMELSIIFCVLASFIAGFVVNGSYAVSLVFLIVGLITCLLVMNVRRRMQILTAGFIAGLLQASLFWLILIPAADFNFILGNFLNGLVCAVTVTGILPLLENIFGIVTNIGLLEFSDFNHPLLKRMAMDAPGTYYHSLIVGNLAEAAAEEIGANSLLTRIGAYYHDIGKLNNAEYFSENKKESDKHLNLSPSMSKMVIVNHIKEGLELARKHRIKPAIADFITQHHGNSLVYYFYRKALEEMNDEGNILEDGFRYPGPKPSTKETAIVLLADSVEAAARAMTDPQPSKIEEVVHKIVNNKFIDGQLDECELTLRDLEKIAKVFTRILIGIYHGRIKYPEFSKKEDQHQKPD